MTTETTKKSRLDENNSPLSSQNNGTNTPISDKINTIRTRISDVYRKNFQKMVNTEKEILTEKEEFEKIQTFQNDFEKFETQLFYNFGIFVRVDNENKIILSEGLEKIPDKIIENNEEYQQILRQIQDFQKQAQQITEETGVPHGDSLPDFLSSKSIAYALKHNKKIFLSSIGLETFSEILQKNPQFLEYKDTIEKAYGVSFNEEMLDFLASKNQDFLFDYYDVFNINKDQKDKIFEFFQGKNIYEQMRIIERFGKKFGIISQEYAKPLITEKQWFTLLENNFEDYNLSDVESQELIEYCTDKSFLSKRYFSKNFLKKLSNKDIAVFIGKEISDEYVNILLEGKTQEEINQIIQEVYLNTSSIEKALILASHYNTKLQLKLNKKDYFYEKKFLHLFPDEDIYAILLSDASYYQRAEDGQIIELQREFTQEQLDFIKNTIISTKDKELVNELYDYYKYKATNEELIANLVNDSQKLDVCKQILELYPGFLIHNIEDAIDINKMQGLLKDIQIKKEKEKEAKKIFENIDFEINDYFKEYIIGDENRKEKFLNIISLNVFKDLNQDQKEFIIHRDGLWGNIEKNIEFINKHQLWEELRGIIFLKEADLYRTLEKKIIKQKLKSNYFFENHFKITRELQELNNFQEVGEFLDEIEQRILPLQGQYPARTIKKIMDKFERKDSDKMKYYLDDLEKALGISEDGNIKKTDEEKLLEIKNYLNEEIDFIEKAVKIYDILAASESHEVKKLAENMFTEILDLENPEEYIRKIEKIFLENNLPYAGKLLRIFEQLYRPDKISEQITSIASPYLQGLKDRKNNEHVYNTFFKDLLKTHILSGEKTLKNFLQELKQGRELLKNQKSYTEDEKSFLITLSETFLTLVQNKDVKIQDKINSEKDFEKNFAKILETLSLDSYEEIFTFFEKNFLHPAGFGSIDETLDFMEKNIISKNQESKNRSEDNDFAVSKGDIFKGFDARLYSLIGNRGFVAREFIGTEGNSDRTPFDIDLILVGDESLAELTQSSTAADFGDTFMVIKSGNPKIFASHKGNTTSYKNHDFELFQTGVLGENHYGIRTAIPTTLVDFYVHKSKNIHDTNKFFFQIAKSGIYIPVVNPQGELIFSYEDFTKIQKNIFSGIKEIYDGDFEINEGNNNAKILEKIIKNIPEQSEIENVENALEKLKNDIREVLESFGMNERKNGEKQKIGFEIQSTGSTGRNTFLSGDGSYDFDIDIKLDEKNFAKINEIIEKFVQKFHSSDIKFFQNHNGTWQILQGEKDDNGKKLEVDLMFSRLSNDEVIDANVALEKRLNNIREVHGIEKYYRVLANIRAAKEFLKEKEVYKKMEYGQGGLGGIGIEAWILNHGGSFEAAAKSFLETAKDENNEFKNFSDFKREYFIFGAGESLKDEGGTENFVNNMTSPGYNKMIEALKELFEEKN